MSETAVLEPTNGAVEGSATPPPAAECHEGAQAASKKITKAAAIREAFRVLGADADSKSIARFCQSQFGIAVSPQDVANTRKSDKEKAAKAKQAKQAKQATAKTPAVETTWTVTADCQPANNLDLAGRCGHTGLEQALESLVCRNGLRSTYNALKAVEGRLRRALDM